MPIVPNHAPKLVSVLRTNDNKTLKISWSAIIPNHTNGEGDVVGYEIEYRNKKIDSAIVIERVLSTPVYIEGLSSEGIYEVRVRCMVMTQSVPLRTMYEKGPWSAWVESGQEHTVTAGK